MTARLAFDAGQRRDVVIVPKGGSVSLGRSANALTQARLSDDWRVRGALRGGRAHRGDGEVSVGGRAVQVKRLDVEPHQAHADADGGVER